MKLKEIKTSLAAYQVIRKLKTIMGLSIGNYEYLLDGDKIEGHEDYPTGELTRHQEYIEVIRIVCSDGWVEAQDIKGLVTDMFFR